MRPGIRLRRHRGTTAHLASVFPFPVQAPLGGSDVVMGLDLLAGGAPFRWDPFEAYAAGVVTNPNVWVLGEPGHGKSALVKCLLWRMAAVHGLGTGARQIAIADPKGEYVDIAHALGLTVVRLTPGGSVRLNPLAAGPTAERESSEQLVLRRAEMLVALVGAVLDRPLAQLEDAVLFAAVEHAAQRRPAHDPTLVDVATLVDNPPEAMANRVDSATGDTASGVADVGHALDKLLNRSLRGMFDGPSTVVPNWDGPGILLDLSAVPLESEALPLVLVAATAWLQQLLAAPGAQRVQVIDEAWALLGSRHTAGYLQSCWKLGRAYGVANIAVAHRPSDLAAQADDGTATAKVTAGLLADTATKVVFRQAPDQILLARAALGLTALEAEVMGQLGRGRSLWKVGGRTSLADLRLTASEERLCGTDTRMKPEYGLAWWG